MDTVADPMVRALTDHNYLFISKDWIMTPSFVSGHCCCTIVLCCLHI